MRESIGQVTKRIVFLLMGAQIILGALWFLGNFTRGQFFAETGEILEISSTWVLDEYVGILYPALVWMARGLESIVGIPYQYPLYIVQFAAVYMAAIFLLAKGGFVNYDGVGKAKWKLYYGAAYISTVPMIMQFQLAELPHALASAAFLIVIGECIFLCKNSEISGKEFRKNLAILVMGWLIGGLLLPEYIWLMALPVCFVFGFFAWKKRKLCIVLLVTLVSVLLFHTVVANLYQEPGSRGRMQKSAEAALLRRIVWPNFQTNQYFWDTFDINPFTAEELSLISCEPELIVYMYGPGMEQVYGVEEAENIYLFMSKLSWELRTKEILGTIVKDAADYICPQLAILSQLKGNSVSYSGWNYNQLVENTPVIGKSYVNMSLAGFCVVSIAGLVAFVAGIVRKRDVWGSAMAICSITMVGISLWYTMETAGMWNYRNVLVIFALWAVIPVAMLREESCKENRDGEC